MATYNVGNIEIGASANTNNAIANLNNIIIKLTQINIIRDSYNKTTNKTVENTKNIYKTTNRVINKNIENTKNINKELKNTSKSVDSLTPKLKKAFNIGTLYLMINYLKRFSNNVIKLIGYASDYTEILNKFQVSFSQLYKENLEYVNKLSSAYGFSKATLMDYQSTFNNMLKSLKGLTDESSALISRTITQMAIDYSSLFNVSISRSMRAFQSVLSGSIRPIREVSGFDVSETSIFQVYKELGGTKTMRQLNQLEKRLLRIIAIQQQMAKVGAYGDYARTIETLANQIRIFQEQLKEFGSTYGQIILKQLKPFLQYANGILIALNKIGKYLITIVDISSDIKMDEEFASIETNVIEADEAVQELNESLSQLGLDQINVLGGTGSVSSAIGVDENILKAVGEYVSELDKVNFKAKEISNTILSWVGFTINENGEITNFSERITEIKDIASTISTIIITLLGVVEGYKLISGIIEFGSGMSSIVSSSSTLSSLATAIGGSFASILAVVTAIVTVIIAMVQKITDGSDESQKWIDSIKSSWENRIKPALVMILDGVKSIFHILKVLYDNVVMPVAEIIWDLLSYSVIPLLGEALQIIGVVFEFVAGIVDFVVSLIAPAIKFILEIVREIIKPIEWIISAVSTFLQATIGVIKLFINLIIKGVNWIIKQLNKLSWTAPDWLGGWTIGFDFKEIPEFDTAGFTFPKFAKGNVATQPTLGMFGEYANATSNPEITAPQSILKDTFVESMVPFANAIIKGNQELAKSIKDQKVILNINGKELAEATIGDYENVALRKGKELYSK